MKSLNRIIIGTLLLGTIFILNPSVANAAWKENNVGWWYTEGNSWSTGWKNIDGTWYYFNPNGYMKTGWSSINGDYYYFYDDGSMAHDSIINGFTLDSDGKWISKTDFNLKNKLNEKDIINKITSEIINIDDTENYNNDTSNKNDIDGIN